MPISGTDRRGKEYEHFAFLPNRLPRSIDLSSSTWSSVVQTSTALGRLDQAASGLLRPELFIRPAIRREAQSTSALEGTHAAFTDLLEAELREDVAASNEVREVRNFVRAAEFGFDWIQDRPINVGLIEALQGELVKGTRAASFRDAGQIRDRQVVIGPENCSVKDARYVPPPAGDPLKAAIEAWLDWIADDSIELLVRAALGHYQFEALHPFSDGNGRVGRLLVVLQLLIGRGLSVPVLIVSPWFEARRREYQDNLLRVSQTGDFETWIRFFLEGLNAQANQTRTRIERLQNYQREIVERLRSERVKGVGASIGSDLIGYPAITPTWAAGHYKVSYQAANSAVQRLEGLGVLREITGQKYDRLFVCDAVLEILEEPSSAS